MCRPRLACQCAVAAAAVLVPVVARGAIISSGNVIPPFNLPDTEGSPKVATVDPGGTSHGGVIVGDELPGTLTVDNGWTLNSLYGVVSNDTAGNGSSGSRLLISGGSTWNVSGDLDVGKGGNGFMQLNQSTLSATGQVRTGTLGGAPGTLAVLASHMTAGSVVSGVAGGGTVVIDGSTLDTGFIEVGRDLGGTGSLVFSGATVHDIGGLSVGLRGSGTLTAGTATINTSFTVFGNDTSVSGPSSASSAGTGTLTGPGADWTNAQGFIVALNTRGSFTMSSGATLSTGFLEISRYASDGSLSVDNSTITVAQNPGYTATPSLIVGTEAGSVGRASFSGPNASLTVGAGGFLEIGRHAASARLDFTGGAHGSVTDTIIGTEQDGTGVMNLSGAGTTWAASGDFEVARNGHATLTVSGGATLSSLSGRVGENATGVGSAGLSDPGTMWTTSGAFEVAGSGSGTLSVANGAAVNVGAFISVANDAGGHGMVDLSANASISSAQQIQIGGNGAGTLVIRGGAHLGSKQANSPTFSSGLIGRFADGSGSVTVSGAGSLWSNDGAVNVGVAGPGALTIDTGGRVQSSDGVIARLPGSHGTATLTGAGSTWSIAQTLHVGGRPASNATGDAGTAGPGGTALLSVANGATVTVGNSAILYSAASTIDVSAGGSVGVGSGSTAAPGAVHVFSGGSLWGTGNVKGNLVNDGSVAAPNLSVQGNYTQSQSGLLGLHVTAPGTNDTLSVTGTSSLEGTLELDFQNFAPAAGQTFRLILSPGVSGSFSSVVTAGLRHDWNYSLTTDSQGLLLKALGSATADIPGDASGDGTVNFTDLLILAQHYGKPALLSGGDFNGDGTVTFADLLILAQHYGQTLTPAQMGQFTSAFAADVRSAFAQVPEPGSVSFVAIGCFAMLRRRRAE